MVHLVLYGLASSSFTVCQMGSNTAWCFGKIGIQTIYLFKELLGNEKKLGQKDYRYEQSQYGFKAVEQLCC